MEGISIKSPGVGWDSVDGTAVSRTEGRQSRVRFLTQDLEPGQ